MEKRNPFKSVGAPPEELPEHLKEKVMRDVIIAKSLMEIYVSFTNKYREAIASLFNTNKSQNKF